MSRIEWTQQTWNPIIGCSKISEGCANCYAETMAARLASMGTEGYPEVITDRKWNGKTAFVRSQLAKPLLRKKPTVYFVGSMTDIFHESIPDEWVDRLFAVMGLCFHHRFIVLTKRPERMHRMLCESGVHIRVGMFMDEIYEDVTGKEYPQEWDSLKFPLPNVILGVTAENQNKWNERTVILRDTPAAARMVSVEPQLELIVPDTLDGLDWIICGGESGPGARPMHPDWARGLRDQCKEAGVPFFFKQWGEFSPIKKADPVEDTQQLEGYEIYGVKPSGKHLFQGWIYDPEVIPWPENMWWMDRVGKKKAGNLLDGQVYEQYPEILREVLDV